MNNPQFEKGQVLTAAALNAISQNQRELSNRVGAAGYAARYVGPQQLKPVPLSTGSPQYLDALAAPSAVGGVYMRAPWVENLFSQQTSEPVDLSTVRRANGDPLAAGDEIFQKITVSDNGSLLGNAVVVFPQGSAPPVAQLWEPGSGSSVELYKRLGSVRQDPRYSTTTPDGSSVFRPFVVQHADAELPILPRNAAVLASSVGLVAPLDGCTIPVKQLVPGNGVALYDAGSSVEINVTGGGTSYPLAQSTNSFSGSVLNISTVVGVVDGIGYDPQTVDSSVLQMVELPTITNGRINLPRQLFGFVVGGSSVTMPNLYTGGAQRSILATLTIGGETRDLCASFNNGFLELSFV